MWHATIPMKEQERQEEMDTYDVLLIGNTVALESIFFALKEHFTRILFQSSL